LTAAAALDPCRSLAAGAEILSAGYAGGLTHAAQQSALRVALSRYNTGDAQRGFANGYVERVVQSARVVVPAIDPIPQAASSSRVSIAKSPEDAPVRNQPSALMGGGDAASPWLVWADDGETVSKRGSPVASAFQQTDITADDGQGASAAVTNYASLAAK